MTFKQLREEYTRSLEKHQSVLAMLSSKDSGAFIHDMANDAFIIQDEIFQVGILVTVGDFMWSARVLSELCPGSEYDDEDIHAARLKDGFFSSADEHKLGHIWLRNLDFSTLTHEAVHAAGWVAELIGMTPNASNEEFHAYYVQFIVRCFTNCRAIPRSSRFIKLFV